MIFSSYCVYSDAVNYRVVRQHVFQHVPFYTNLLYEFLIHAQNHAKLENDRKDILDVPFSLPYERFKARTDFEESVRVGVV